MTDTEIRAEYNTAKNKRKQVEILADLNACSHDEMIAKLKELGCEIPEKPQKRPYRKLDPVKAMELYKAGMSQREMARELGVAQSTVGSWLYRERLLKSMKPKEEPVEEKPAVDPVLKADLLKYAKKGGYMCSSCGTEFTVLSGGKDETKEIRCCPWCGAEFMEG